MHFSPNSLPYGVYPAILIDCADQLAYRDDFSLEDFCEALGAPEYEAMPVLMALIGGGAVQPSSTEPGRFDKTKRFTQIAAAKISDGLPREKADALLRQIIATANAINAASEQHECRIACIVVFGSYLGDKAVLGDLDIGVELESVRPAQRERKTMNEVRRIMCGGATPFSKAKSALRLRKPKLISVHHFQEVIELETPYRVVFGQLPATKTE